ncbi:MAG: hypothetical protein CSB44_02465 [Gammaproteobacteria bacterium]|nr:MAG: hypothetical protein CSB44_02465 [Gammaproteobacteria bacterium]
MAYHEIMTGHVHTEIDDGAGRAIGKPLVWLLATALFLATGWLIGFTFSHRDTLMALWLETSEQQYLTMTDGAGPVTYLVHHADYAALEQAVRENDEILGVEIFQYPNVAAMAFLRPDSNAIDSVAALPTVERIEQRFVPMICH